MKTEKLIRTIITTLCNIAYIICFIFAINNHGKSNVLYQINYYELFLGISLLLTMIGSIFLYNQNLATYLNHIFSVRIPLYDETKLGYKIYYYIINFAFIIGGFVFVILLL